MSKSKDLGYRVRWFLQEDSKEERKLIIKLDLLILPYAFLLYWTKYMDQSNISPPSRSYHMLDFR
jgi:hypothetical protein